MAKLDQNRTPYLDALKNYIGRDTAQLDVPGHQQVVLNLAQEKLL